MRSFIAAIAFTSASAYQTAARKPLPMPARDYGYEEPTHDTYEEEDDYGYDDYGDDHGYLEPW